MSTISRRTFLKLAGVTAVATAGASMLTGCKVMEDVDVTIKAHLEGSDEYTSLGRTTMPYGIVKLVMIDPIGVLNIVKSQYPQYKDVQVEVDKEVPGNGEILTDPKTGKMTMELTIKILTVEVEYEVSLNGEIVTSGKRSFPKGLTNIDEENVLLTLFAKKHSNGKLVTKVNRLEFDDILAGLDLGSVVYPKYMTCDYIVQYVRALQNEAGNNIKTLYRILDDRVEALEFTVHEESAATGVPLSQLHLKKNLLLCCITRGSKILIPRGGDQIQVGDNVIVVTLEHGLHDLRDIVEH